MAFVQWENLLDILTHYSVNNSFIETFKNTPNNEKVTLCMQNEFIRSCLERWLDDETFNDSLKCSEKSNKIRLEANGEFKKNRLELCCKLYTKAAQFAPFQSLELALAFSNRSAVYIRLNLFQDCLKDIETSLDLLQNTLTSVKKINKGEIVIKLLKRKIECLMAINQYKKAQTCWENLLYVSKNTYETSLEDQFVKKCKILSDYDKNDSNDTNTVKNISESIQSTTFQDLIKKTLEKNKITLPFVSPKLKLCYLDVKGKHFVASANIEYGELLIFENPFAFVLLPEYYSLFCYNCCAALKYYSIPCHNCCTVLFCGEKCLQESWDSYHCWECKQGTSIFKRIGIAHLALRLTFETLQPDSNNDKIHSLLTHIDDLKLEELLQYSLTATLLLIYLQKKTDFFEKRPHVILNSVGSELLYHMARLVCNGNAISSHMMSDYNSYDLNSIIDESQPRIGTAIFPTSSLLNHSCDPNIFSSNILNYVVVKASRDIKKGEEVTNCYGPNFRRMKIADRQSILKSQYHFYCNCCICEKPYKDNKFFQIIEGLVCLICKHAIQATMEDLNNGDTVFCDLCSRELKTLQYKKLLIQADKIFELGMKQLENNNTSKAIEHLLESLKLYSKVLNQNNSIISKNENSLAKCFAVIGNFENCYKYLDRSFGAIEERFGKNSLEVAYELDKISDIIVNKLDLKDNWSLIQKALVYVRRSIGIFNANLSAWDIPYNESDKANLEYKEQLLLQLLEERS